jgi:hypothetical protein
MLTVPQKKEIDVFVTLVGVRAGSIRTVLVIAVMDKLAKVKEVKI